ncbi:TIGR04255 family protein [Streptomyces sp. NBC_01551]|uniref:TIGR04255 family protein n=1 Tax=Streptomyces sp. NBC_01551 TaxID=2975876 RepID=UPI0022539A6F|nr:TIGR04255 family protein [Streptomyces sp. NBC_01551]MCX4528094.1 TIGR04255 family protein [Streptomyces sp. NBC_01551]
MTDSLRFEQPPVREVTLALMLEPIAKLQTLDLAPLRVEWRSEYPTLQEATPLARWRLSDGDDVEFMGSGVSWPMGLCTFSTESGDKSIKFQQDRFLITWTFGDEAPTYPGFAALKGELLGKFSQYVKLVSEASGAIPIVRRVDAQYVNYLPGVSAQDAMAGILSGWSSGGTFPFRAPDYCGFRIRYRESELNSRVAVLIGVDSAGGEDEAGDFVYSSTLALDAEGEVGEGHDYVSMLESAHDVLTSAFLDVTSIAMRASWGETP